MYGGMQIKTTLTFHLTSVKKTSNSKGWGKLTTVMVGMHTTQLLQKSGRRDFRSNQEESNWIRVKGTEKNPGKLLERMARHD